MIVCVTQCFVFFYSVAAWWQIKMFNTPFFLCFSSCTVYLFFKNYSIFISKCLNSWSLSEANNLSLYLKHGKVVNSLSLYCSLQQQKKSLYLQFGRRLLWTGRQSGCWPVVTWAAVQSVSLRLPPATEHTVAWQTCVGQPHQSPAAYKITKKISNDQLWAALLTGRNAVTWHLSLSNAERVGGQRLNIFEWLFKNVKPWSDCNIEPLRDHAPTVS